MQLDARGRAARATGCTAFAALIAASAVMPRAVGRVEIDTRPLWVILLTRGRTAWLLLIGVLICWSITQMTPPEGLDEKGLRALAVFALCVFYWLLEVVPVMITSLLAIVLLPTLGVMSGKEAYAQFGNEAVFFILGAFILAAAMMQSGLSARLALVILRRFGDRPTAMLRGIFLLNGTMSFLMSEHAVAAMTFPIIVELVRALRLVPGRSQYGRALFLAMAWGTTIGGVATLLGGARAPLAIGILREVTGQSYSFTEWAVLNVPLALILLAVGWGLLRAFFKVDLTDVSAAERAIEERLMRTGRVTLQEMIIAAVMAVTVAAWVLLGEEFGLATIALFAVVMLFAIRAVRWKDVEGYVNWGLILMYGGAICLGGALNRTGAATWLAQQTIAQWAIGPASLVAMISAAAILLTILMSNSAAVAVVMPVSLALAQQFGLDPRIMAPLVAIPAGLDFALPIGTPANAIAYSSGFLRIRDMAVPGLILTALSLLVFNLYAWLAWPWLGAPIQVMP
jgi:sodium-dependent dicarboxylate transporter 2/3/5